MADLVVIVPSRGRPGSVDQLVAAFEETCAAATRLLFALDLDDPTRPEYEDAIVAAKPERVRLEYAAFYTTSMVGALNAAVEFIKFREPKAIGFMGDDHRPRTKGWDAAYLEALAARPGLVYGNDLVQGESLPTQVAMSADLVRALGHMAPPTLTHLYVDNYWLALGQAADCITYLPDVVVEHLHPSAGTAPVDDGYLRVNSMAMFSRDETAMTKYWETCSARDIAAARSVAMVRG
jgi:hypothetical protein